MLNASPASAVPIADAPSPRPFTQTLSTSLDHVSARASERIARIRPVTAAALFGVVAGLVVGAAYLGGQAARAESLKTQAQRLDGATSAGFTEEALAAAAGGLDASALTIARRHDPYSVAGGAQRDRQAELLTARLETLRSSAAQQGLRAINLAAATGDAARPFRLANALDASRDLECLTQAAYYEARGEGGDGMRAVTQVVLNRVRHPAFPKTICGVVYQGSGRSTGCQFSFTCNGTMRATVNRAAWNRARTVASAALSGSVFAPVGNATHFHTTAVSPSWRNALVRVNQVGQHLFYRFGGRAGSRSAFAYDARPSAPAEQPQLMQASLNPVDAARPAGQAVAYTAVLAQEARSGDRAEATADHALRETAPAKAASSAAAPASARRSTAETPAPAAAVAPTEER
ncbi:cell wall hydrolase [Brevundimonas sp. VNH65]|uniref:cell wall hydrolase n=1 Tax=Brevundimonas sp. VNH65 TaxID=3400917 RepID=UPI003C05348C